MRLRRHWLITVRLRRNVMLNSFLVKVMHGGRRLDELISGNVVLDRLDRSKVLGLGQVGQHGELLSKL